MTVEENARLEASIADAILVQQQFFQNQFTEANDHSEKVCSPKLGNKDTIRFSLLWTDHVITGYVISDYVITVKSIALFRV